MSQSKEGIEKPSAIQRADTNMKMMYERATKRMASFMLASGVPRDEVEKRCSYFLTRIQNGCINICEVCGGEMPVAVLDDAGFNRTTCSNHCEEALPALRIMQEEEERGNVQKDLLDDALPGTLRIVARLSTAYYDATKKCNRTVVITSADLADVEELGAESMVSISHRYAGIPRVVRISSFLLSEQPAIVRSLIEQIPLAKAKKIIFKENMQYAQSLRTTGIAI